MQGISNQRHGVYSAGTRICHKHPVTDYHHDKERKWVQRSGYTTAVCCDACDRNEQEAADCDWDVEELCLSNGPARSSAMLVEVTVTLSTVC